MRAHKQNTAEEPAATLILAGTSVIAGKDRTASKVGCPCAAISMSTHTYRTPQMLESPAPVSSIHAALPDSPFVSMDDFLELGYLDSLGDLDYCQELIRRCESSILFGMDPRAQETFANSRKHIENISEDDLLKILLSDRILAQTVRVETSSIGKRDLTAQPHEDLTLVARPSQDEPGASNGESPSKKLKKD